jgi:hypothetical protein
MMECCECERLLAELDRWENVYFDALGRAGSDTERANPNHYFRLRKAVQDAKLGLDLAVEILQQHQDEHALVH